MSVKGFYQADGSIKRYDYHSLDNIPSSLVHNTSKNLLNYYLKTETYTKEEVQAIVSTIPKFSIQVVTTLPTTDISGTTVYLLKNSDKTSNLYTEYIYVDNKWEILGSQQVDLSGYAKIEDIPTQLSQLSEDETHRTVTDEEKETWGKKSDFSGDYNDLKNKPSKVSEFENDKKFVTDEELNSKGYAKESGLKTHKEDGVAHITDEERQAWNNKSNFSGNYNDLSNKPTIPSLSGYATETYVKNYSQPKGSYATQTSVDNLSEEIVDLEKNKANIIDVQAWIIQQTPLFAESEEWLVENGDTSKVYILDGQIYAWIYKESTGPSYKNWLLYATNTDRTTLYNGKGYKESTRLNSSGVDKECEGMMATGFIPVKKGDIIRLKNIGLTTSAYAQNICFYDSSNTQLGQVGEGHGSYEQNLTIKGQTYQKDSAGKYEIVIDTSAVACASNIANCNAVRLAFGDFTDAIITVNEEIVGGGSSGGYGWYTTGHTFVPANYEDRIIAIERAIENGDIGGRLAIASIVESTEDGGENIITFSDGRTLTVKNGRAGSKGQAGIDGQNGTTQIEPLFAESVSWLNSNGNTSKLYILPDNYVYAYTNGSWKSTGNAFISTDGSCQKYLNDRNTYIYPVPSGYCESKVEYDATATHYLTKYDFATMTGMFTALATSNPNYVVETTLGKDATGTYNIKSYVLDTPSAVSDGYESAMGRSKPTFIVTSGLHGVEPDAVHMVYHFMKDLCENYMESDQLEYLRNNVRFVIVPISNPWGYVNKSYNNSNDVDLNKNFAHGYRTNGTANTGANAYSEAETVLLKGVFDTYPNAVFHLECHGKYGDDTAITNTIWFSLMRSLNSDLIELCAEKITSQIGRRLYKLGHNANKSVGGYITYYNPNGRPKDYTGAEYGMLSATMEGTGKIYGTSGYSVNTQKVNCEALENFILRVLDSLNSRVEI